jgi:hypothetical protein
MADKFGVLLLGKALHPAYLLCVPGGGDVAGVLARGYGHISCQHGFLSQQPRHGS